MNSKTTNSSEDYGLGILGFILAIGGTILSGYVISILWKWFAVPLGAPTISVALAIGLRVLWGAFCGIKWRDLADGRTAGEKLYHTFVICVIFPLLSWGIGWIVHKCL